MNCLTEMGTFSWYWAGLIGVAGAMGQLPRIVFWPAVPVGGSAEGM